MSEEEYESRSNITCIKIPAILHFDGNVKDVLESLSGSFNPGNWIRARIYRGTATKTLEGAKKFTRWKVYKEYLDVEYGIDEVQEEILIDDEGVFLVFCERDFPKCPKTLTITRTTQRNSRISGITCTLLCFAQMCTERTSNRKILSCTG